MVHPLLTPVGSSTPVWLAAVGTYGSWSDLSWTTRWGDGACDMFEASWAMPLPPDFEHPLLRRGTLVELMEGPYRIGSPLILSEPARGTGVGDPWRFTATGIGREVEGDNSFYAFDGSLNATAIPTTAVDQAIARGWRITGRNSSVSATQVGASSTTDPLNTVGALLNASTDALTLRWGVGDDNLLYYYSDPTTPTWHVIPEAAALGRADDGYASGVYVRYVNSSGGAHATVSAVDSQQAAKYGVREYPVDLTSLGPISTGTATAYAASILSKSKGRLAWTNGLTLTSNDILTVGGVPADLSMVQAGQMLRIKDTFNDLLDYNGQTWLDIIIGETKYTDGALTIDINPLGLAARDLAHIVEEVTGMAADAA